MCGAFFTPRLVWRSDTGEHPAADDLTLAVMAAALTGPGRGFIYPLGTPGDSGMFTHRCHTKNKPRTAWAARAGTAQCTATARPAPVREAVSHSRRPGPWNAARAANPEALRHGLG